MKHRAALLLLLLPSLARADAVPLDRLLERSGLHALTPTPAPDVKLADLAGREISLSEQAGHWVLLTFFATWCGPCASEMPGLEALHKARAASGFRIFGVAVDAADGGVPAYARAKGLTFPILLDTQGAASSLYRASSIPTSFLIDPAGRLVAVSRGARDWSSQTAFVDALTAMGSPPDVGTAYAHNDQPVALPSTLVPPTGTVSLAPGDLRPGRPFELVVAVRWAGERGDYVLHPPDIHLPDGVQLTATAAGTSSATDAQTITYRLQLVAAAEGRYALDPVVLRYTPAGEATAQESRIAGVTVEVTPVAFLGWRVRQWLIAGGVLLSIATAAHLLWHNVLKKRRRTAATPDDAAAHAAAQQELKRAHKARSDGDSAAALAALLTLEPAGTPSHAQLAALHEAARFGGQRPPEHVLDSFLRDARRRVAALAPDPHNGAEQDLDLIDDAEIARKERP